MADPMQPALDEGIAAADPAKASEYGDVTRWLGKIEQTRKFDEAARKQYSLDRRYARGDSGSEVAANILGTFIDISESYLYAKNPDVDVLPAKAVEPPPKEAIQEAAEFAIDEDPATDQAMLQAGQQAAAQAVYMGVPPEQAVLDGQIAGEVHRDTMVAQKADELHTAYAKRQREAKQFAETMELLIGHAWARAQLKKRGRKLVRAGLTIAVGILKASWQHRTAASPETTRAINDLEDNIKRAAALREALDDPAEQTQHDALLAEYRRQLETLRARPEPTVSRGYVIDCVSAEDFVVAPGYALDEYTDAPWVAHRIPTLLSDAKAIHPLADDKWARATKYYPRKPVVMENEAALLDGEGHGADQADPFSTQGGEENGEAWVMLWEIWDRDSGTVLTAAEGVPCWIKPAWRPTATTRFYAFFLYCTSAVDGQRHPQSLVTRSMKLVDEYNRIGGAEAEHRRRIMPNMLFNAGAMDEGEVDKVVKGRTGEYIPLKTTTPKQDLRSVFVPKAYPQLDPALYSRATIIQELERVWGIQEALSGAVTTQKTATEAEIENGGFQARTGSRRDLLDMTFGELATYTAEVLWFNMTYEEVVAIAGPAAWWPEPTTAEDLAKLVAVDIRAGSSGKPNTSAERQAWSALLPLLQQGITTIAQLRGSTPADLADAHERLLRLTVERSGDRIDLDALLPKAPLVAPMMPGAPAQPGMPPDPTTAPPGAAVEPAAAPGPVSPEPHP